jgi:regulator of RNase E activity RraA
MPEEQLATAFVADALDAVGIRGCLGPSLRMLNGGGVILGRALTAETAPSEDDGASGSDAYAGLKELLHRLGPGDVAVLATGRCDDYATWGELTSMIALRSGAIGIVTDGLVRDVERMSALPFTVVARGMRPIDIAGRGDVRRVGEPVVIDGVSIATGDLIVADHDGVAIVPKASVGVVMEHAQRRAAGERGFHEALDEGASIWEALDRFGVL